MNQWVKQICLVALCGISYTALAASESTYTKEQSVLKSTYQQVILKSSHEATQACKVFKEDLNTNLGQSKYQEDFKHLMLAWKKVEANYIAPDMNSDMQDIPVYLDVFHMGNEDIPASVLRALKSQYEPQVALFKNSYKTFTALETVLYSKGDWSDRRYQFTQVIVESICGYLNDIEAFYVKHEEDFIKDTKKAMEMIINQLASQSFKLKDWRLGDPAGLTIKYKGKPDASRAEYALSGLSMDAVRAIIKAQREMMGDQPYDNFATLLKLRRIDVSLDLIHVYLSYLSEDLSGVTDFTSHQVAAAMKKLSEIHLMYYTTILNQLPVEAKILEADGD